MATLITEDFDDAVYVITIAAGSIWTRQTTGGRSGGHLNSGQVDVLTTIDVDITIPAGAATVRLWYAITSPTNGGLRIRVDGVNRSIVANTSGVWTQSVNVNVAGGTTLTLQAYDTSGISGTRTVGVDDLTFTIPDPFAGWGSPI